MDFYKEYPLKCKDLDQVYNFKMFTKSTNEHLYETQLIKKDVDLIEVKRKLIQVKLKFHSTCFTVLSIFMSHNWLDGEDSKSLIFIGNKKQNIRKIKILNGKNLENPQDFILGNIDFKKFSQPKQQPKSKQASILYGKMYNDLFLLNLQNLDLVHPFKPINDQICSNFIIYRKPFEKINEKFQQINEFNEYQVDYAKNTDFVFVYFDESIVYEEDQRKHFQYIQKLEFNCDI
ncbi:UNKNOWN [Stylonychia lemnae]|uniref:Uncharacterized protein n=1 Tax=Stylonychia lemnae TaxID=5949 RepID=A0A078A906_STYLE|nr:UNKNOWN [Stylonychia lemnae]|eukprot:CDW78755.1 UNKNOWN [Stylonychia lemnae]